ncbi:unnamed protein product [Closterium sp. Naga37s-1]|nr:unnamed protein product [Closterium sp. Naga37s-1]
MHLLDTEADTLSPLPVSPFPHLPPLTPALSPPSSPHPIMLCWQGDVAERVVELLGGMGGDVAERVVELLGGMGVQAKRSGGKGK